MLKRAKSRRLEPIGRHLAGVLDKLGLSAGLTEYQAVVVWDQVVGARVAQHTQAYSIEKGELLVLVDSSAWMQELRFLKPDIRKKLNSKLGGEIVKEIRFMLRSGKRPD